MNPLLRSKKLVLLKVSQQTAWQMLGKIGASIATLIILSAVSQTYKEEGTGIFTLTLTYLSFFYLATDLSLNAYLLPNFIKDNDSSIWQKLLGLRLILTLISIFLAILLLPILSFNTPIFTMAVILGVFTIIGSAIFATCNGIFQSKLSYKYSAGSLLINSLISFIVVSLFIRLGFGIPSLFLGYLLGWLGGDILALFFIKKFNIKLTPLFDYKFIKTTLISVWPISATLLLNTIYFRIDTFILTSLTNFTQVGIYNLAFSIFQSALVIPTFIMNSYYPLMVKDLEQGKKLFLKNFYYLIGVMFILSILGVIFTFLLAPTIINLITNQQGFAGSIASLQILALGFPAFFISSALMWALISFKKYKTVLVIYTVGLFVNIILNLIFIPKYSILAPAVITGISEYLILILQIIILIPILKSR